MPRAKKPARLWLRPARKGHEAIFVILDGGQQISTGCGADQGREAEEVLARYIGEKRDPAGAERHRPAHQVAVADVLSVYLEEVAPKQARPGKTAERAAQLLAWWGDKTLADVTSKNCEAYAKSKGKGGARRDLEDLRAAINYHARKELHKGVVTVELPAKGKPRSKYLTRSEVARLLWACWRHKRPQVPPRGSRKGQTVESANYYDLRHIARFILMGIYTGSRSTPILRASIYAASGRAYLDLDAGLYYRRPEDMTEADNKQSPTCRIPARLLAHLRRWRDRKLIAQFVVEWQGEPVKSIKTGWKTAVAEAGLSGKVVRHTLRHTCVTWLKQKSVSSFDVGNFVGMSEAMVERVYGHHDPNFQSGVHQAFARRGQ